MQATAATPVGIPKKIWHETVSPLEGVSIKPLIELAITETKVEAGFIYCFGRENRKNRLVLSVGSVSLRVPALGGALEIDQRTVAFHWDRLAPVVLYQGAASDPRFRGLPEFRASAFEAVVSIPLVDQAMTVGMANFYRKEAEPWRGRDVAFLLSLSLPLGAVISASVLKSELARTSQKLADRKLLDRAKGVLQSRLGWSEEEAYLQVRRISRQRRIPMREIAREIIQAQTGGPVSTEAPGGD